MDLEDKFDEVDPPAHTRAILEKEKGALKLLDGVEEKLMITLSEDNPEDISDIDDHEISNYILTTEETSLKSKMWHQENGEWLENRIKQKPKEAVVTKAEPEPAEEYSSHSEALMGSLGR
jgi:hypothetical protein